MTNMMKHNITLFAAVFVLLFCSCDNWLDIEPIDSMSEDKVFSSQKGFTKAINGVYLDMVNNKLYGLSSTVPEVLAQRYYITEGHTFQKLSEYAYTEQSVKNVIDDIWKRNYKEIANCNEILVKLEEKKEMLGEKVYLLMKGEVLGLRAFLHFDLLRLFAPAYEEADEKVYVPYYDEIKVEGKPLLTSKQFTEFLLNDLNTAELALKGDPTLEEITANFNYRFNYYAVKLIQARVYQWKGTVTARNKAYQIATSMINKPELEMLFPFITRDMAEGSGDYSGNPDRIFYTEIIFALQNNNRPELFEDYFQSSLGLGSILAQEAATVDRLYSSQYDYRKAKMWGDVMKNDRSLKIFQKYEEIIDYGNTLRTVSMSVLRCSEFYLIAADCAPSEVVACQYLNILQEARGYQTSELTKASEDIQIAIRAEYSREFFGEGQYFYYLKKQKVNMLDKGNGNGNYTDMNEKFVLPLPDDEVFN